MTSNERAMIMSAQADFLSLDYRRLPNFSGQKFLPHVFLTILLIFSVSLAWPKQVSYEVSLSPENLLYLANQDREKQGLRPLRMNARLSRAAYGKAEHMLRHAYFAHTSPEGVEPWDFIRAQNFDFAFAGENLAMNYASSYELENDFMNSPSHRENLLSPMFSETGIAVLEGEFQGRPAIVTVQVFASPASNFLKSK